LHLVPDAARATKIRNAGLRRNARACEHNSVLRLCEQTGETLNVGRDAHPQTAGEKSQTITDTRIKTALAPAAPSTGFLRGGRTILLRLCHQIRPAVASAVSSASTPYNS